jgi:hypothetical protein
MNVVIERHYLVSEDHGYEGTHEYTNPLCSMHGYIKMKPCCHSSCSDICILVKRIFEMHS